MNSAAANVETTLRIPGNWSHPGELQERLPAGCTLTPEALCLPDDSKIEFASMPPDGQFAQIFASSCRQPATDEELAKVGSYSVNIGLIGPGGSLDAARTMMQAGAAIIRAGGAGVFIDNCGLAHGGGNWLEMADDGSPDALSYAFVAVVRGDHDIWTMGMHVLGFPEVTMRHKDVDPDGDTIVEIVRYVCNGEKPFGEGHIIVDEQGPRFQAVATTSDRIPAGSPMHNPFGHLKLLSIKDVAEGN